jgi:dTDP-4-dehydrorhamnose reductase
MRRTGLKILVTGADGMLGTDVCSALGESHEVCGYDVEDFDIVDARETARVVVEVSPSVIVHTAAFTDVEACEDERRMAFRTNALGAMHVAKASREAGCLLIYISTDFVFDGSKRSPYTEMDRPCPVNYYGLTKLYGENYVRSLAPKHLVIRTSWLFGPNGRNFVDTIIEKASGGGRLRVVNDQRGCPTYTRDLAVGVRSLIDSGLEGVVHMTNSGDATWFDLARYAIAQAGLNADIEPVGSASYPTRARRPAYSVLGSDVLGGAGLDALPPWEEAVRHHLARRRLLRGGESS